MNVFEWRVLMVLANLVTLGHAGIDLRANIKDVFYRGVDQQLGAVTLNVRGNDLLTASQAQPEYLRIRLELGASLQETLVDVEGSIAGNMPIYLAARLEGVSTDHRIVLNPESVSIIRWIAGESDIWVRVSQPTETWIEHIPSATFLAPAPGLGVSFTLGISASQSWFISRPLYLQETANMQANSRLPVPEMIEDAEKTLLLIDLSISTDLPYPDPSSFIHFDIISFTDCLGVTTEIDATNIVVGLQTPIVFSGDDIVGRGVAMSFFSPMWPSPYSVIDLAAILGM